jgi:hypothetical protein
MLRLRAATRGIVAGYSIDVGAQHPGDGVMARYRMLLAAFLVQLNWPAGAFGPEILGLHARGRAHAREDVGEGGDERAVT